VPETAVVPEPQVPEQANEGIPESMVHGAGLSVKQSLIPKTGVSDDSDLWKAGAIFSFAAGIALSIVWGVRSRKTLIDGRIRWKKKK